MHTSALLPSLSFRLQVTFLCLCPLGDGNSHRKYSKGLVDRLKERKPSKVPDAHFRADLHVWQLGTLLISSQPPLADWATTTVKLGLAGSRVSGASGLAVTGHLSTFGWFLTMGSQRQTY